MFTKLHANKYGRLKKQQRLIFLTERPTHKGDIYTNTNM